MISVIIPIYNVAPYVERCLSSVLKQTYDDIEIIIIDDCGQDNSMEIIDNVIQKYSGPKTIVIYHHDCNRGLSAARNTGIKHATGEYLIFLDSDDEMAENALSLMVKEVEHNHPDFVIGNINVYGSNKFRFNYTEPEGTIDGNQFIMNDFISGKWYSMAVNKLVNKSFILRNSLFFKEGILHEDELWSFKLALKAVRMSVLRDYTYYYFIRQDSITGNVSIRNYRSNAIVLCEKYKETKDITNAQIELFLFKQVLDFYYSLLRYKPVFKDLLLIKDLIDHGCAYRFPSASVLDFRYLIKYMIYRIPIYLWRFILPHKNL